MIHIYLSDEILVWLLRHPAHRDRTVAAIAKGLGKQERIIREHLTSMLHPRGIGWVRHTTQVPMVWSLTTPGRRIAIERARKFRHGRVDQVLCALGVL